MLGFRKLTIWDTAVLNMIKRNPGILNNEAVVVVGYSKGIEAIARLIIFGHVREINNRFYAN